MNADKFFLDTNIIIYGLGQDAPEKMRRAEALMEMAQSGRGCVSFQVVQEFINVAQRKFRTRLTREEIAFVVNGILLPICKVNPNPSFYLDTLETQEATHLSWYDSLILQAAIDAGCKVLYSEDLQDGFRYRGVTVKNPFE